jgi:hypothetical protein
MTIDDVCIDLVRHPIRRLIGRWHWKSVTLSAVIRGGLFFATNLADGTRAATRATLVEFVLLVPLVGILAAVTQAFRGAEPGWAAALVVTAFLPTIAQAIEFVVHWIAGTPELGTSMVASVALSIISTAFSLYAMRRGVMVVGSDARSLANDVKNLPRLFFDFALTPLRALAVAIGRVCP